MAEHEICNQCCTNWFEIKIMQHGMTSIPCPGGGCETILEYQEIEQHAEKKVFKRFDQLLARKAIEADPNFRWCSKCESGQLIANGGIDLCLFDLINISR